jgi:hypothetical protein
MDSTQVDPRVKNLGYTVILYTINRLGWKNLPGKNALAYFATALVTKKGDL